MCELQHITHVRPNTGIDLIVIDTCENSRGSCD